MMPIGSKSKTRSYDYTAVGSTDPIPSGTYAASGKVSPNGIFLLGPRVGYAFDQWLPYFRIGGAFAGGQHTATLAYTPAAANRLQPTASAAARTTSRAALMWASGLTTI